MFLNYHNRKKKYKNYNWKKVWSIQKPFRDFVASCGTQVGKKQLV